MTLRVQGERTPAVPQPDYLGGDSRGVKPKEETVRQLMVDLDQAQLKGSPEERFLFIRDMKENSDKEKT